MAKPEKELLRELVDSCDEVWKAFLEYGPVDDGRPEGDRFDQALVSVGSMAKVARKYLLEGA